MKWQRMSIGLAVALASATWAGDATRQVSAAAAATSTAEQAELREEFHQTYPLTATGRIGVENINGAVRIVGWERNEVRVDAVKRATTRERLDEAKIEVEANADGVSVRTRYPQSSWNERDYRDKESRGAYRNPATVEYTLSVPRGARIASVELINGALDLENLSGEVKASAINGHVAARGLAGEAKLSTINGALEVVCESLGATQALTLNSVNGAIVLTLPSDANANVKASTVHGPISNEFGLPVVRGEYIGTDLAGQLGAGGARVKLNNVNGSIELRHARDGRALSAATNLLRRTVAQEADVSADVRRDVAREIARELNTSQAEVNREVARAAQEIAREMARETARADLDAGGSVNDARNAGERARAARELARSQQDLQRAAQRMARDAERQAERALRETEGLREAIARGAFAQFEPDAQYPLLERESKSFPVSGNVRVTIATFDGPVTVQAWDKPEVMFNATKRARDQRALGAIRVRAEQSSGTVNIAAEFDKAQSRGANGGTGATVALEVFVPRQSNVRVNSGDGRLRLSGVEGTSELRTGDGGIDVAGARGEVRAETGDGRIRIVDFDGAAYAQTGDGRITLDGRFSQLTARTNDGAISLALAPDATATIETDAESVVNDGLATADDGGTTAAADNDARRVRRWRVGTGGGGKFTLRTGSGQVFLRKRAEG